MHKVLGILSYILFSIESSKGAASSKLQISKSRRAPEESVYGLRGRIVSKRALMDRVGVSSPRARTTKVARVLFFL